MAKFKCDIKRDLVNGKEHLTDSEGKQINLPAPICTDLMYDFIEAVTDNLPEDGSIILTDCVYNVFTKEMNFIYGNPDNTITEVVIVKYTHKYRNIPAKKRTRELVRRDLILHFMALPQSVMFDNEETKKRHDLITHRLIKC